MRDLQTVVTLEDRGGRRSGLDRRSSFAPWYIPEKRFGQDRRIGLDRRVRKEDLTNLVVSLEPKRDTDRYIDLLRIRRMFFLGPLLGSLMWAIIISVVSIFLRVI
jgi:hypothetical protein